MSFVPGFASFASGGAVVPSTPDREVVMGENPFEPDENEMQVENQPLAVPAGSRSVSDVAEIQAIFAEPEPGIETVKEAKVAKKEKAAAASSAANGNAQTQEKTAAAASSAANGNAQIQALT